jgi:hypothetical protein
MCIHSISGGTTGTSRFPVAVKEKTIVAPGKLKAAN